MAKSELGTSLNYPQFGPVPTGFGPLERCLLVLGLLSSGLALWLQAPLEAVFTISFLTMVLVITRSDVHFYIIPDRAVLLLACIGLFRLAHPSDDISGWLSPDWVQNVEVGMFRALLALFSFWSVRLLYFRLRGHHGLGFGDVKLAAACAIWLSPTGQAVALEIAALLGLGLLLSVRRTSQTGNWRATAVPFGALLAPAAFMTYAATLLTS